MWAVGWLPNIESYRFRNAFIAASYVAVVASSITTLKSIHPPPPYWCVVTAVGLAVFAATVTAAVKIHSMFPKERHDRPEDFKELMTSGPYAICRHPFYLSLILNQFSIALTTLSWVGLAVYAAMLPGWYVLIRLEERELISYWGDKYVKYMERVPALIPLPKRRRAA